MSGRCNVTWYDKNMESQQPLGQPVNPNPTDPQFVPQPLGSGAPKPKMNKKLWWIVGGVAALLLVLGVGYWQGAKGTEAAYREDVAAYEQRIKEVRDGMNTVLDDQNILIRSPEAPPVFEEYGKKLQEVIASRPKQPKVLLVVPVGGPTKNEADALTTAAANYAGELCRIYELFIFYDAMADAFKPIHDIGTFTVFNAAEIKSMPGLWTTFLEKFRALTPPAGLESFKDDMTAQAETLLAKFTELANGFDGRTIGQNDDLITGLSDLADTFSKTFQQNSTETSNQAIDNVNRYYDELDSQLKY